MGGYPLKRQSRSQKDRAVQGNAFAYGVEESYRFDAWEAGGES